MAKTEKNSLQWDDFTKIEMRVGTVLSVEYFVAAKKPAYIMIIDFGKYGIKKTSAQITKLYKPQDLIGKQVIAVTNFKPKQIATIMSECLVLGAMGEASNISIIQPERSVKNGTLIG